VADVLGDGVGGECGVEPATGVPDEDVARRDGGDDRVPPVGKRRLLVDQRAVAR
jgi:hypothetical protein